MEAAPNATDDGILQDEQAGGEPHPVGIRMPTSARVLAHNRAICVIDEEVDPMLVMPVDVFDGWDLLQDHNRFGRSI